MLARLKLYKAKFLFYYFSVLETHSHRFSSNSRPSDTDAGHNMSWVLYTDDQNKKEASSGPFSFHRRFDQNIGPSFDLCEADPSALKELETDFASQCTDDDVDLLKYDNNQVEETAFTLCSEGKCSKERFCILINELLLS